jgi:RNA polymerase sigma factor (sigma-70 family)
MSTNYRNKTEQLYQVLQELTDANEQIQVRNKIIELNIRLVSEVLKKYRPYTDDNFQNGCLGLIQAAETYQPMRGVPFSSYAYFCIERAIQLAYRKQQRMFEAKVGDENFVRLDATITLGNGDQVEYSEIICDDSAMTEMEEFIDDNELTFVSENIIKPCIDDIAARGKHMPTKVDVELWKRLEYLYIMDVIFIDSQKQRFNLSQMAKQAGLSVQNIRMRHERVMEHIFQRMWDYMTLPFTEMLERLRGTHTIPNKLLCIDPGKTTGWCLFEEGKLTASGEVPECYDDSNVNVVPLINLIEDVKPDYILYEDYKIYSNKLARHSFNPVFTVRLIGAIETHAQMNKITTHKQMASAAKGFVTDEKLKQWGFYKVGKKHSRDAIRHGCYFLLFYKRGQDIV